MEDGPSPAEARRTRRKRRVGRLSRKHKKEERTQREQRHRGIGERGWVGAGAGGLRSALGGRAAREWKGYALMAIAGLVSCP